jgi:ERCC4-type nuclease
MNDDFKIIIDTREQKPWIFENYETTNAKLDTGDYSIQGMEHLLAIERKRNVSEFANNITEKRFKDVIDRLNKIPHSFILFEFDMNDIMMFPIGSDIPKKLWPKIRISPTFILKNIIDLQINSKINFIFCSNASNAQTIAASIMKYIHRKYNNV